MKSVKKIIFFSLVSFLVFLLLLKQINFSDITSNFKQIQWQFSFLAFMSYIAANIFRACRFSLILNREISLGRFLQIVALQNFWSAILPLRLGEISYLHLVNKNGVKIGPNIASLIGARVLDFLVISGIFFVSLLFVSRSILSIGSLFWAALVILAFLAIAGSTFIFWNQKVIDYLSLIAEKASFGKFKLTPNLLGLLKKVSEGFNVFRGKKILISITLLSFFVWCSIFLSGFFLLNSVGLDMSFGRVLFVYSLPVLASLVPFFVLGGIGIYEASTASGLMLFGVSRELAISASLVIHLQELLFMLVFAAFGFVSTFLKHLTRRI